MQHDVHIVLGRRYKPVQLLGTGATLIPADLALQLRDHVVSVVDEAVQFSALGHRVLQHGLEVAQLSLLTIQLSLEPLNSRILVLSISLHLKHNFVLLRMLSLQELHLLLEPSTLRRGRLYLGVQPQQFLDLRRQILIYSVLLLKDLHVLLVDLCQLDPQGLDLLVPLR